MPSQLPGHNPYFKLGGKDVWSLINEAAAAQEKASGEPVVNLGQGFFSYSPPPFAIQAAKDAFDVPSYNQYAHTRGKPNLLKALAKYYSTIYGRELSTDEVQVTTGANEGMLDVFTGLLERGDEVIVFEPFFDQYISNIELSGGKVVYAQIHPPKIFSEETVTGSDWTIDFDEVEALITAKTKMIVINTPHNPIGKIFSEKELRAIGDLAVKYNLYVLSDEVYEHLYYTKEIVKIATLDPEYARRTLTVGSAGKSFAATGWRIGWIIGDPEVLPYVTAAHTRICFSTPAPLQEAVASALDATATNGYFEQFRQDYIRKYKLFTKVFDELNLPYTVAEGAYYLLVNFKKVKIPAAELAAAAPPEIADKAKDFKTAFWLIKTLGVVAIPPSEFYTPEHAEEIEECLRFAVCKDDSILEEAVVKLRGLKKYIE